MIASDLGSRRELVENGETGLLYRVQDVGELAGVIAFLHERPALARQMGDAGREFVRSRHSQEEHFLALERIYAGLGRQSGLANSGARRSPDKAHIAYIGGRGVVGKYSGIETYYEETGKRLVKSGHQITIYCRNHFTPETGVREGVRILRLPTIRTKHLDTFVHSLISTVHASFSDYDVIHYHTLGPALFSLIPRMFGKKTVVTVQGLDWQRRKWGWVSRQVLKLGNGPRQDSRTRPS